MIRYGGFIFGIRIRRRENGSACIIVIRSTASGVDIGTDYDLKPTTGS